MIARRAGSAGDVQPPRRAGSAEDVQTPHHAGSAGDVQPPHHAGPPPVTHIEVETDRGVFMISVAAELADMHPQTLRMYEARGLVEPKRSPKGTRLYSQQDVERLRRIHEMTADLGLNLAGVQRVLDLESEVHGMHARIEELELQALHAQVELARELEEVRRSFRAELVPYRGGGPGTGMVRAAEARSPFRIPPRNER